MTNLTDALALLFVDHGVRLVQTADSLSQEANDRIRELVYAVVALILAGNEDQIAPAIAEAYEEISAKSVASVTELAPIEAQFVVSTVNKEVSAPLIRLPRVTVTDPYVEGATLKDWWDAQAKDTAAKVEHAIRAAVAQGADAEAIAEMLTAATSPFTAAQRNAVSLTHTAVQRMAMDVRSAVLQANSTVVQGLQIVATLDSRTCAQCLAYDGATYDLEGEPILDTVLPFRGGPPYHMRCRCGTLPIFTAIANIPQADGEPSEGLTAEKWLDSRSQEQQDEILGKGRAALYRKGNLTLRDLVTGTGKQLSLDDLSKKYN